MIQYKRKQKIWCQVSHVIIIHHCQQLLHAAQPMPCAGCNAACHPAAARQVSSFLCFIAAGWMVVYPPSCSMSAFHGACHCRMPACSLVHARMTACCTKLKRGRKSCCATCEPAFCLRNEGQPFPLDWNVCPWTNIFRRTCRQKRPSVPCITRKELCMAHCCIAPGIQSRASQALLA